MKSIEVQYPDKLPHSMTELTCRGCGIIRKLDSRYFDSAFRERMRLNGNKLPDTNFCSDCVERGINTGEVLVPTGKLLSWEEFLARKQE